MKINNKRGAPDSPRNMRAERTLRRIQRQCVQSRRENFLCILLGRRSNLIPIQEVPVKVVVLSGDEEESRPADIHQDPPQADERSGLACSLLESTPNKKEAQEVTTNPLEAAPNSQATGLIREQLEALFDESSSEENEDDYVPILFLRRGQYSDSPAPGEPRPASTF